MALQFSTRWRPTRRPVSSNWIRRISGGPQAFLAAKDSGTSEITEVVFFCGSVVLRVHW
jgi:hypothetical protein